MRWTPVSGTARRTALHLAPTLAQARDRVNFAVGMAASSTLFMHADYGVWLPQSQAERNHTCLAPAVPGQRSCPMNLHESRLLSSEASLAPQDGLLRLHIGYALKVVKQAQPLLEP